MPAVIHWVPPSLMTPPPWLSLCCSSPSIMYVPAPHQTIPSLRGLARCGRQLRLVANAVLTTDEAVKTRDTTRVRRDAPVARRVSTRER